MYAAEKPCVLLVLPLKPVRLQHTGRHEITSRQLPVIMRSSADPKIYLGGIVVVEFANLSGRGSVFASIRVLAVLPQRYSGVGS